MHAFEADQKVVIDVVIHVGNKMQCSADATDAWHFVKISHRKITSLES